MPTICSVRNCESSYDNDDEGFFPLPSVIPQNDDVGTDAGNPLIVHRAAEWLKACQIENPTSDMRICSRHFVKGKPAELHNVSDIDWAPSLHLPDDDQTEEHLEEVITDMSEAMLFTVAEIPESHSPDLIVPGSNSSLQESDEEDTEQIGIDAEDQPEDVSMDYENGRSEQDEIKAEDQQEDVSMDNENETLEQAEIDVEDRQQDVSVDHENGTFEQDSNASADTVNSSEVEIKEEEIDLDDEALQDFATVDDDPFDTVEPAQEDYGASYRSDSGGSSTDTADETIKAIRKENKYENRYPRQNIQMHVPGMMITRKSQHVCLDCGQLFSSTLLFAKHIKTHVPLPGYPHCCMYCPRKFRQKVDLLEHLLHHTKLEEMKCPLCSNKFHTAQALADHVKRHTVSVGTKQCISCLARFSTDKQLETHSAAVHSTNNMRKIKVKAGDHVCFCCGKAKSSLGALHDHIRTHIGPYNCVVCFKSFKTADNFIRHVESIHNYIGSITYYCCKTRECAKRFVSAYAMRLHQDKCYSTEGCLVCEICEQGYREVDHFVSHLRLHSVLSQEASNVDCNLCSMKRCTPARYAEHMVFQHGVRDRIESLLAAYRNVDSEPSDDEDEAVEVANERAALDCAEGDHGFYFSGPKIVNRPGRCIVPSCQQENAPGISFHGLPNARTDISRRKLWLQALELSVDPAERLVKVCSKHFLKTSFRQRDPNDEPSLKDGAVPLPVMLEVDQATGKTKRAKISDTAEDE